MKTALTQNWKSKWSWTPPLLNCVTFSQSLKPLISTRLSRHISETTNKASHSGSFAFKKEAIFLRFVDHSIQTLNVAFGRVPVYLWLRGFPRHGAFRAKMGKWSEVKVAQLCPIRSDPMDYTVHGILQARVLEWVAFPFSRGSSQPRDQTQVSHIAGGFFTSWATRKAHNGKSSEQTGMSWSP